MHLSHLLRLPSLALLCGAAAHGLGAQAKGTSETHNEAEKHSEEIKRLEEEKAQQAIDVDSADGESKAGGGVAHPANLAAYAYPHVTTRPRRLAPGENGTLVIVFALQTPAVVVGDASISMTYEVKQGLLQLGTYSVVPATPGTLDTKFKGQLVHDNTLTVEIPVVVAPEAKFGEVPVTLSLKASVANGASGAALGELSMPVQGRVTIGRPVPRPMVRDTGTGIPASTAAATTPVMAPPDDGAAMDAPPPPSAPAVAATALATNADGVSMDVRLDRSSLPLGESATATVTLHVPAGRAIARGEGSAPVVQVLGADAGVSVEPGAWTPATSARVGDAEVQVSRGTLSLPVVLRADADAMAGLRQLQFKVTYRDASEDENTPRVLTLPVVLSVGNDPTVATPALFYVAGIALALLLLFVVVRAVRR
ncbi:MAG: hypothetical protein R3F56_11090 [Planctomycetota bacterium]